MVFVSQTLSPPPITLPLLDTPELEEIQGFAISTLRLTDDALYHNSQGH